MPTTSRHVSFIVAPRAAALDRVFAELAAATTRDKSEIGQLVAIATIEPAAEADSGDRRLPRGHGPESQEFTIGRPRLPKSSPGRAETRSRAGERSDRECYRRPFELGPLREDEARRPRRWYLRSRYAGREGDDLARVGRIGEDLLVSSHRRIEAYLPQGLAEGAEASAPEDRAVLQDQHGFLSCVGAGCDYTALGATDSRGTQMSQKFRTILFPAILLAGLQVASAAPAEPASPGFAVGTQYDASHVYVAPDDVGRFAASFLATFGGQSTKQVVATVTPTPSSTTSQLLQTPVGTVSLFGFKTPIPYPFGEERTGYLVTDMDAAVKAARADGAAVIVAPFPDPIGRDVVIQWPGGVNMQLYVHFTKPSYPTFQTVPENRVYVSPDRVAAFVRGFLAFSHGKIVSDDDQAPGIEIGRPGNTYRRIRSESGFGKMTIIVTDGHLPYPYGRETTGYQVANLADTLAKAKAAGAATVVQPYRSGGRDAAIVEFPGGYIAEIHALVAPANHASRQDPPRPAHGSKIRDRARAAGDGLG